MDEFTLAVLKPNEALNESDFKTILSNKEKWNDEEKERFSTLTETGFPAESEGGEGGGDPDPKGNEGEGGEGEAKPDPEPTAEEKLEIQALQSKKEIDEYVAQKKKELEEAGASREEIKDKKDEIIQFWKYSKNDEDKFFIPQEEAPKDWNHAFTHFLNFLREHPEVLVKDLVPHLQKGLADLSESEKKQAQQLNEGFDQELRDLNKQGKIADPKTPEGQLVDALITRVGATYKLSSMKDAYELWAKMSPELGGGFGYKPGQPLWKVEKDAEGRSKLVTVTNSKKETVREQKRAAAKIGGGGGGAKPDPAKKNYGDLHRKSLDDLMP